MVRITCRLTQCFYLMFLYINYIYNILRDIYTKYGHNRYLIRLNKNISISHQLVRCILMYTHTWLIVLCCLNSKYCLFFWYQLFKSSCDKLCRKLRTKYVLWRYLLNKLDIVVVLNNKSLKMLSCVTISRNYIVIIFKIYNFSNKETV